MKRLLLIALAGCAVFAFADKPLRVVKTVPPGTNVVVAARFGQDVTVNPTAYDIVGVTNGTCAAYAIQLRNGRPVTNTYVSAAAVAATNAISNADIKKYLYGDPILFLFSNSNGGQIWVYGTSKE